MTDHSLIMTRTTTPTIAAQMGRTPALILTLLVAVTTAGLAVPEASAQTVADAAKRAEWETVRRLVDAGGRCQVTPRRWDDSPALGGVLGRHGRSRGSDSGGSGRERSQRSRYHTALDRL